MACAETLPPGDIPVPWDHPIVSQTVEDCLNEAMDAEGLVDLLRGLRDGRIRRVAVDTPEPSPFAHGILNAMPYAFLDDAPLEERRTQAVIARRGLDPGRADTVGALDPDAVARVREEAWPQPQDAEEVHEALLWMGFVRASESRDCGWMEWLDALARDGRALLEGEAYYAAEAPRDPKAVLAGRLEAFGPLSVVPAGTAADPRPAPPGVPEPPALSPDDEPHLLALEGEGIILRCRLEGRTAWCSRRLLARIQRYTLDRLRREIEPVSAAVFWRYLARWQHAEDAHRLEGPRGLAEVLRQLAGHEIPAAAWETGVLPSRVRGYRPDLLDQITLSGEFVWGRLWGAGGAPPRGVPICLVPRDDLDRWLALAAMAPRERDAPSGHAASVLRALRERGALFTQELARSVGGLPSHMEIGLAELIAQGLATCDSFAGLRRLIAPAARRRRWEGTPSGLASGRWSLFRADGVAAAGPLQPDEAADFLARRLLDRYGILFRRLLVRERAPAPWRDLARVLRNLELRGEIRGGRFVGGFAGEQFALPGAVEVLRDVRRRETAAGLSVGASDPLNLQGILTPAERIPPHARRRVQVV